MEAPHPASRTLSQATKTHNRLGLNMLGGGFIILALLFAMGSYIAWRHYSHDHSLATAQTTTIAQSFSATVQFSLDDFMTYRPAPGASLGDLADLGGFAALYILDARQNLIASTPDAPTLPLEGFFNGAPNDTLEMGDTVITEAFSDGVIPIRRSFERENTSRLSLVGLLDTARFYRLYDQIFIEREGSLSLFRDDGMGLFSTPMREAVVGKSLAESELFGVLRAQSPRGATWAPETPDGTARLVAWQRVEAYPLVVTAGLNADFVERVFWQDLWLLAVSFCGVLLLSGILFWQLHKQYRKAGEAQQALIEAERRLSVLASTDSLTGCLNRRAFLDQAQKEHQRYQRTARTFALLLMDLDQFKTINDDFGHIAGDEVLQAFSATLHTQFRPTDSIGRYGGEEFLVLLPDTDFQGAMDAAERLRAAVEASSVSTESGPIRYSVSIGLTVIEQAHQELFMLISAADGALYDAKQDGRNTVRYRLVENIDRSKGLDDIG